MSSRYVALRLHPRAQQDLIELSWRVINPAAPDLDYAPPDDWHITLAFLGEVVPAQMPSLHDTLMCAALDFGPIPLALVGAGQFGGTVLWMDLDGEIDRLTQFAETIRLTTGADTTYPFRPHMILGKDPEHTADLDELVAKLSGYQGPPWMADRIHLMASNSEPGWGVDKSIASWPLEGLR